MSHQPLSMLVTTALMRGGDKILLVEQQGEDAWSPTWALPGGVVEPGKLLL